MSLTLGEQEIIKSCAVRNDLTDFDVKYIDDRISGKLKKLKMNCVGKPIPYFKRVHRWVIVWRLKNRFASILCSYKVKCSDCDKTEYFWEDVTKDLRR